MAKREQVLGNFKAVEKEIAELESAPAVVYSTASKYIPSVGYVAELADIKQVVKAQKVINEQKEGLGEAAKELGLTEADLDDEATFMGFPITVWSQDIKNRLAELKSETRLAKLKAARKTLRKNLSKDDKFDLEMGGIDDILSTLKIEEESN
jgi:predicted PhzF superfamily epimerase YddE/YHI9